MTKQQLKRAKEIDEELSLLSEVLYLEQTNDNYGAEWHIDFRSMRLAAVLQRVEDKIVPILYDRKQQLEKELEEL